MMELSTKKIKDYAKEILTLSDEGQIPIYCRFICRKNRSTAAISITTA